MTFEVFDNSPPKHSALTVDKFARLYMNTAAMEEFGFKEKCGNLYIGYDIVNKRIGLAKPNIVRLVDTNPISFDKRSYAYIKRFLERFKIDYSESKRYLYVGKENGWYMFELEGYDAPDAKAQENIIKGRKQKG